MIFGSRGIVDVLLVIVVVVVVSVLVILLLLLLFEVEGLLGSQSFFGVRPGGGGGGALVWISQNDTFNVLPHLEKKKSDLKLTFCLSDNACLDAL